MAETTCDFVSVTEISGDEVSREQVQRLCDRYYWSAQFCRDKDVVEVACGTGQGLGYLQGFARSIEGGDIDRNIVKIANDYYGDRLTVRELDALNMPYEDNSKDVIILFEAIYYLSSAEKFVDECRRVLRPGGYILIATANKDLSDFNPSPYSHKYYGVMEMKELFHSRGFTTEFFAHTRVDEVGLVQKVLRPVKAFAVKFHLIPNTMAAKKLLKRVVFGKLVKMPHEVTDGMVDPQPPEKIESTQANVSHKVVFCAAQLKDA